MKLDLLIMAAHPDDAELSCAGTIARHVQEGRKVGIVDFSRGEMGSRGTPEQRLQEAEEASRILGIAARENMGFADGFFENDEQHQRALIRVIRKYRPEVVLANALEDRHPDHGKGALLAQSACFLSGLQKITTTDDSREQDPWRPGKLFHYIQDRYMKPDVVVDISGYWDVKFNAIKAYKSQFYDPGSKEPETYISHPDFLRFTEARAREMGHAIGVTYGEGFVAAQQVGITDFFTLI